VKSDLVDLTVCLHAETDKAVLVSDDGNSLKAQWIPKSQCECVKTGKMTKGWGTDVRRSLPVATLACPEWIAKNKGLL